MDNVTTLQSLNHLIKDAQPWDAATARREALIARQLVNMHGHAFPADELTRENCGACMLKEGLTQLIHQRKHAERPNYAGWARAYVQAGVYVPWSALVREIVGNDNAAYVDALKRDIVTYGLRE